MYSKKLWIYVVLAEIVVLVTESFLSPMVDTFFEKLFFVAAALLPFLVIYAIIAFDSSLPKKKRIRAVCTFVIILFVFVLATIAEIYKNGGAV